MKVNIRGELSEPHTSELNCQFYNHYLPYVIPNIFDTVIQRNSCKLHADSKIFVHATGRQGSCVDWLLTECLKANPCSAKGNTTSTPLVIQCLEERLVDGNFTVVLQTNFVLFVTANIYTTLHYLYVIR